MGLGSAIQGFFEGDAIKEKAQVQKSQANLNAKFIENQAKDAILRGDRDAREYDNKVSQIVGRQRTGFAAQNVVVESGTAQEVQESTFKQGELDILTIQNNAYREAWGFRSQAEQVRSGVDVATAGASNRANSAIAGGFIQTGASILSLGTSSFGGGK